MTLTLKDVTKRFKNRVAVDRFSMEFQPGVYGLLGPNGAGKTTLLRCICGLYRLNGGSIQGGESPGYLPQSFGMFRELTLTQMMEYLATLKGLPKGEQEEEIRRVLDLVNLSDRAGSRVKALSGGMVRRAGIAQALLGDPEVVILDEPTVGLDPKQIIEIRSLIRDLGHDHTVILSSHILSEVQAVCQTILILSHGKLVACDTPAGLEKRFAGGAAVELVAEAGAEEVCRILTPLDHILNLDVHPREDGACAVTLETDQPPEDLCRALFFAFSSAQRPLLHMAATRASLEDIFLELTADDTALPPDGAAASPDREEDAS